MNANWIYRLNIEMGLQLRNKTPNRRVDARLREDPVKATHSNEAWAMDFVHDQLVTGRKVRVLKIVPRSRASRPPLIRGLAIVVNTSCKRRSMSVPRPIPQSRSASTRDLSLCRGISTCGPKNGVTLDFSRPGKPTGNAFIRALTASSVQNAERALVHEP